ncbi:MAG: bifunctional diaminohydroxyphosphoribosylaminopyrimidine deaminase/5-amino-6-(5-phosphoribosylamino)uracil reductase RibD [Lachnospiraceae bacterium]
MEEKYMRRAMELAKLGMGHTSPNPMVGCVVVKDDAIIAEGYHEKIGGFHAERNALTRCSKDTTGAELYVTLEPCCHYGKTPPCTEIIIEKKIKKVYVGSMDPNPLVAGKGVRILQEHGIEVECGILKEECDRLNEVFFHYIQTKTPFVVMKYAMTLDGKIACETGDSKWVTGEASRNRVQQMRKQYSGIMAGIKTVLADDPMLNCRIENGVDPTRIICDSALRIPLECKLVQTAKEIPTIVVTTKKAVQHSEFERKKQALQQAGVEILQQDREEEVDLQMLMHELGERGIDSILLEGGGTLNASALKSGIVHRVNCFVAPKLVGGKDARSPIEGNGILKMKDAALLRDVTIEQIESDFLISGRIKEKRGVKCSQEL